VSRLIGAPPGYVGYEEGGQLTEKIRRRPYAVVLLDEIEKAHPDVFNMLLQVMEEGRLTDSFGRQVDFRNTILILTTNAGADAIKKVIDFEMTKVLQRLHERGLELLMTDEAKEFIIKQGSDLDYGARPLRRAIEQRIEDPLAEELLRGTFEGKNTITVEAIKDSDGKITRLDFKGEVRDQSEAVAPAAAAGA